MMSQRCILQNTTSEVMWSYNVASIEHEGESLNSHCSEGTLDIPALQYVTSLAILRLRGVGRR